MPWHAPNSSRIGFSLRRQTIRCCCLEDLVRCWWSGQNQSSQKHATFWEMYGDSRFRISGTLPKLNLGWSAVTKGSTEAGCHEVFLLYILYGLGCSPSLAATVSTSNCFAFLVGDPYWPEGVASQCMWSLCFFSEGEEGDLLTPSEAWIDAQDMWTVPQTLHSWFHQWEFYYPALCRMEYDKPVWGSLFINQTSCNVTRLFKSFLLNWSCNYRK